MRTRQKLLIMGIITTLVLALFGGISVRADDYESHYLNVMLGGIGDDLYESPNSLEDEGIVYDKANNVLTITNATISTISTYGLGSGFTINVVGTNSVEVIEIGYGSLTIKGEGTLNVNSTETDVTAITINKWAEGTGNYKLTIDKMTNVNIKSAGNYIEVLNTKTTTPIVLKNGESITAKKENSEVIKKIYAVIGDSTEIEEYYVMEDNDGNEYVMYSDANTQKLYTISTESNTSTDGKTYYTLTEISISSVQLKGGKMILAEDIFHYTVAKTGTELEIKANPDAKDPEEETTTQTNTETSTTNTGKTEEKVEVKVEAAEETAIANAAAEEVAKLVKDIVDGKKVDGISEELQTKIVAAVNAGKTVTVEVSTPEVKKEEVKEDAEKVENKKPEGTTVAAYYDIDVLVKIDNETVGNVTELGDKIKIAVPIPTGLPVIPEGYTRQYFMVKVHNGEVEVLPVTVENDKGTFETDGFSTYALAYKDVKNTSNPKTGDNIVIFAIVFAIAGISLIATKRIIK